MDAPLIAVRPDIDVDGIGRKLARLGRMARAMPPAWDGAAISHLLAGPGGEYLGRMLPGRGVYVLQDPATLGLRKLPPFVFPSSPVKRLINMIADPDAGDHDAERVALRLFETVARIAGGAVTTYDDIIAGRAAGKANDIVFAKASVSTSSDQWEALFRAAGQPGAGSYTGIPGGAAHKRTDNGALSLGLWDPTGGDAKYLLTFGYGSSSAFDMIMLADLLVACGAILATTAADQTVNSTALTRYTTGAGVMACLDVTTALSNTAHTIRLKSYTDQGGTGGADTGAINSVAAAADGRVLPNVAGPFFHLAAGDYGLRSVETFACGTALVAGAFALNLYFPLCYVPGVAADAYVERDSTIQIDGITELVMTGGGELGCLVLYGLPGGSATGELTGFIRTVAG